MLDLQQTRAHLGEIEARVARLERRDRAEQRFEETMAALRRLIRLDDIEQRLHALESSPRTPDSGR